MENNENDNDLSNFAKSNIERAKEEEVKRKQWRKEISENTALQEYFKKFNEQSVKEFIEQILFYKHLWLQNASYYLDKMNTDGIKWIDEGHKFLEMILQKKLFDLQCQWRANKITLEGIEICFDFEMWEENIFNCPCVEPITPDDVALMQDFLLSGDVQTDLGWFEGWQDYDELIEACNTDNANRNFPDWYDFYNERRGTTAYMILPDIRGKKENFYKNLATKQQHEESVQTTSKQPAIKVQKPSLSVHDKKTIEFYVNTFENKEIQESYKAYEWNNRDSDDREDLENDLDLLFEAEGMVPIDFNVNWKEGIRIAANKYRLKKIAEALPVAYEQYCMNISMGIGYAKKEYSNFDDFKEFRERWKEKIIYGRKLNGEEENLDF